MILNQNTEVISLQKEEGQETEVRQLERDK
jgi:hypothetical protein